MKHVLLTTVMLASLAACDAIKTPGSANKTGTDVEAPVPAEDAAEPEVAEDTGPNVIMGTDGDDELQGTEGIDEIHGVDGNDKIQGFGGDDELHGGLGADIVFGGDGNDILHGGGGLDRLYGGPGDDNLTGSGNRDYFTFEASWGHDTIEDFSPVVDILDFEWLEMKAEGETDADAYARLTIEADGSDTVIRVTGDETSSVRIKGLLPEAIPADRFRF